jgi:hypothetical protein
VEGRDSQRARRRIHDLDVAAIGAHQGLQSFEPGEDWRWCYFDEAYV